MTEKENQQGTLPDIRRTMRFHAPIQKVWDAVATSEGLAAWFMPNDLVPEVGHSFHLNAGQFGMSPCEVTVVEAPRRLAFRWGKDWTLTFELQEEGEYTSFTLIHSGWSADQVTEFGAPHTQIRNNMDNGWEKLIQVLGTYVEK